MYLASADWMTRNLDKRIELLFPVEDPEHQRTVMAALDAMFTDNVKAWWLDADGVYRRRSPRLAIRRSACSSSSRMRRVGRQRSHAMPPASGSCPKGNSVFLHFDAFRAATPMPITDGQGALSLRTAHGRRIRNSVNERQHEVHEVHEGFDFDEQETLARNAFPIIPSCAPHSLFVVDCSWRAIAARLRDRRLTGLSASRSSGCSVSKPSDGLQRRTLVSRRNACVTFQAKKRQRHCPIPGVLIVIYKSRDGHDGSP